MSKRAIWIVCVLVVLFFAFRLPGLDVPYHQDEWKNVSASANKELAGKFFAHPPFQQMFFTAAQNILGADNMRVLPLAFSFGTIILLYAVVRRRSSGSAAVWTAILYIVSFYSIFASLMIDVDGAIMPFFFVLALYAYDRWVADESNLTWFSLLIFAMLCGFMVKLSFIVAIGAIGLDYVILRRKKLNILTKNGLKQGAIILLVGAGFVAVYAGLLLLIQKIYPPFSISFMFNHAGSYSEGGGRNLIQIVVQGVKAIYYISPVVLLLGLWSSRESIRKASVFWLYLICGFLFYFVIFDFSGGALDKYLMFIVVPLCAIGGGVLANLFEGKMLKHVFNQNKYWIVGGIVLAIILFLCNFIDHSVVPLYPKTEWFSRVLHGNWNVLTPLTGGNGPMGFYVSFLFIALSYIASGILIVLGWWKKNMRAGLVMVLLIIGIGYNFVFAQELFGGNIHGSAQEVLGESIKYISATPSITQVMTFNDIGASELGKLGKYAGRFYAAPQFEEGHKVKFAEYKGNYLVVGIPPLYKGFYSDFFSRCDTLFETSSGTITGKVYSCKPTP